MSAAQIAPRRSRGIFSTIGAYLPHPTRWRHVFGYMVAVYRREWIGSVFSGFIEPLVVLAGLGIGLGVLVGDRAAEITGGVSYVTYIAPALMASAPSGLVAMPATSSTPAKKAAAKATFPPMKRIAPTMMSVGLSGVATMA